MKRLAPFPRLTRSHRWQVRKVFLFGVLFPDAMHHAIWGRNEAKNEGRS